MKRPTEAAGQAPLVPMRQANFELRHLRSFVGVAEAMNFHRAAASLNIAQPALSRQIAALEEALEVPLFERLPRGVRLTVPGEMFLEEVRAILVKIERAVDQTRLIACGASGRVAVGFTSAALRHPAVGAALNNLRRNFPDLHIHANALLTYQQERELLMGRLDAGFLVEHDLPSEFASVTVDMDDLQLVLPVDHPLAKAEHLKLGMLNDENFVWFEPTAQPLHNARLLVACADGGLRPNIVQHSNSEQILIGMVQSGLGLAFVPRSLQMPSGLVARNVEDLNVQNNLEFVWRKVGTTPALRQFVACVSDAIRADAGAGPSENVGAR